MTIPVVDNPDKLVEMVRNDKTHGADYISNLALKTMISIAAEDFSSTKELIKTRPSMAPIPGKLTEFLSRLDPELSLNNFKTQVRATASEIIKESDKKFKNIIVHASQNLGKIDSVFTHSYSSTVFEVIHVLEVKRVICTEPRPRFEGRRMAKELSSRGLEVVLCTDSALGVFIDSVDLAITGADSVLADGSVVNKVGTKLLALAAKDENIPFYIVCNTYKFSLLNNLCYEIDLEEYNLKEVASLDNIDVCNPYFEIVPERLIIGIITERGIMNTAEIEVCV